jgi:hypothetical protein
MKTKQIIMLATFIAAMLILVGCAPGHTRFTQTAPAGFFWGIWHGMIVWLSFIVGLFTEGQYTIYESVNTGWTYNLGFLLGASGSIGGGTRLVLKRD